MLVSLKLLCSLSSPSTPFPLISRWHTTNLWFHSIRECQLCWNLDNLFDRFWVCNVGNHDKTWQKLSLIGLEWSTLKSKRKKLKFMMKKISYKLFGSIGTQSIENRISEKISECKKPITWPFEVQIASRFFQYSKDIIS